MCGNQIHLKLPRSQRRCDEAVSDMSRGHQAKTTVALDYGVMNLVGGEPLHLFGTPGQARFDFMWDILVEGGIGLVLLINNSATDPFRELHFFINAFDSFIDETRVVIGITHMDENHHPTIGDYHLQLKATQHKVPIFEVDARLRRDVALLIEALLYTLDPRLDACYLVE